MFLTHTRARPHARTHAHAHAHTHTHNLEDGICTKVLKFADDTKVFRNVKNDTEKHSLYDDLNKLVKWSEK